MPKELTTNPRLRPQCLHALRRGLELVSGRLAHLALVGEGLWKGQGFRARTTNSMPPRVERLLPSRSLYALATVSI